MIKFNKADLVPLGLITGGILLLIYIFAQYSKSKTVDVTNATDLSSAVPPQQNAAPTYPHGGNRVPDNISIGGSPLYLYNTPPPSEDVAVAGANGAGCDCGCGDGTAYTTQITIPQGALDSQMANIQSLFTAKNSTPTKAPSSVAAPVSGVQKSRYTFSEAG